MGGTAPSSANILAGYAGRSVIPAFRDVIDPEELGATGEPHRYVSGREARSRPPSPLFNSGALPRPVTAEHANRIVVPGAEYYAVTGHELGSFGLLQQGGRVFAHDAVQPTEMIQPATMPEHWVRGLLAPGAGIIECETPVGVALNAHLVWGHFLLEMLARVHLLAKLRTLGRPVPIAVPRDAPGWVREFIALYFSDDQTLAYDSQTQRVRAPCFVLPGMLMAHYFLHPDLNDVVQQLLDRVAAAAPPQGTSRRLYLSRSRHREGWHTISNEAEVEAALTDLGFAVLHPQELSLRAQLAIYAHAECIVAPFSSASHNAIFAPLGTPVFCFGWMNRCQSAIAALRGQPLAYMKPGDCDLIYPPANHEGPFSFSIDCRKLARELPAFLRFADAQRSPRLAAASVAGTRPKPVPERISAELLIQATWQYGRDGEGPAAIALQFLPDGRIGGYDHPNERSWRLIGGVLSILNGQGDTTVRFDSAAAAGGRIVLRGAFLPDPGTGIVLRLERPQP